ncbi:MAG: insulinase family protein [bacterium]
MDVNKVNLKYIPVGNVIYNNTIPAARIQPYASPEYQYQHYQYPPYSSLIQAPDINASMRSQVLPCSNEGYKEIMTFNVPLLDKGKLYKLDNGQNVVIIPKKGPTTIKTFTKVGSFNEEKNRGISHYIEHNLFNGSSKLGPNEFVEKVTSMGGQYNAGTNTTNTEYFIKSPMHKEGDFEKFMTMHADMLLNPTFSDKMLEKEKGPVISEIQMYEDDPSDKSFNLMLKNLFGIKTDYQGLIAGSSKTIANLTKKDVLAYYNEWYRPDNMTTVVVGEVNPDNAIKTISKLFNQKKGSPVQKNEEPYYQPLNLIQNPVRADLKSTHVDNVMLNMAFAGPKNNDIKDSVATSALCSALTGYENARLSKTLKEFNTDGSVEISVINPDSKAPQLISLGSAFAPGKEEEGLKAIYSTLESMVTQPLTQQEISIVKNKLKDNLTQLSESSMGVADLVGQAITGHGSIAAYTNMQNEIEKLTPQDIQLAAQKYLNLNRTSIVMVHPESQKAEVNFSSSNNLSSQLEKQLQDDNNTVQKPEFIENSDKFKFKNIKEYDLPNNLRVAINDDPDSIRTSANLSVETEGLKTLKPGVADILSFILNKGTKNYSEDRLNNIKDTYNLGISAVTDGESINLTADCSKERLPMALGVMKEILYNPDFTVEKFNKAKEEIKVKYSSMPKDPSSKAMEILFPDNNWGITAKKVLENIDNISLQDVQDSYNEIIKNSQGKIAIDGPISKTPGLGQDVFMQLQSGIAFVQKHHHVNAPESKNLSETKVITEAEPRNQADIVQIFKIKESKNIKETAALKVLNEIIGGNSQSRLYTDLRESQKLAYKVKSNYLTDGNFGIIKLLIKTTTEDGLKGTTHENVQKSLDGFRTHINDLMKNSVSDQELETAKMEVKTRFLDDPESSFGRSARIQAGYTTPYGVNYHNKMLDAINELTPQDIKNAAVTYLNQPSVISMIASQNTIKSMQPYLSSLGKVEEVK